MTAYTAGQWIHVAAKWEHDGSDFAIELFQDGTSIGTTTQTNTVPTFTSDMYLGHRSDTAYDEYNLNGILHDVRIYNYALEDSAIQTIYDDTLSIHQGVY